VALGFVRSKTPASRSIRIGPVLPGSVQRKTRNPGDDVSASIRPLRGGGPSNASRIPAA